MCPRVTLDQPWKLEMNLVATNYNLKTYHIVSSPANEMSVSRRWLFPVLFEVYVFSKTLPYVYMLFWPPGLVKMTERVNSQAIYSLAA